MSYEGYVQSLCVNGHYQEFGCHNEPNWKTWRCHCGQLCKWTNSVDDTNCDRHGHVDIEFVSEKLCEHCGLVRDQRFKVKNYYKEGVVMSSQGFISEHQNDENGNPAGGTSKSCGVEVNWQNGPLGEGDSRVEANGAFVEDVIAIARDRIEYYQKASSGRFACRENALAITKLEEALMWCEKRTKRRVSDGNEGTHRGT